MLKPYFKCSPKKIIQGVTELKESRVANLNGIEFLVDPGVYPSDKFRSSHLLTISFSNLLSKQRVCDMGCGPAIVGLCAVYAGAKEVVSVDINPQAVKNAKRNRKFHSLSVQKMKVYQSDCFDQVPKTVFDTIIFNPPFHSEFETASEPIEKAFIDPHFKTMKKFLEGASQYLSKEGSIYIAFSNRGDTQTLESLFIQNNFEYELWKVAHSEQTYDSRIYKLQYKI